MNKEVTVALVTGPAYDPLYERLRGFAEAAGVEVSVGFGGDHSALNRHLASLTEVPYDLVSTHTKYASSQLDFLAPLEGLLGADELEDFVPLILELASVGGSLYGVPRNIDVRLLHYRADLLSRPPATWDALRVRARPALGDATGAGGHRRAHPRPAEVRALPAGRGRALARGAARGRRRG